MPKSRLTIAVVVSLIFPITFLSSVVQAQTSGPDRVLIRNVTLIDPAGKTEDTLVNILIREQKLDLVTEDKISRDEVDMVVNANEGIIVGKLEIGHPPSFLIFSEDPRENFEVMLDTHTYSTFAVHNGAVVKNRLLDMTFDDVEDEPKKSGWLAYTPPPFAVPLNYQDTSKWNRWETRPVSGIFIAGLVLDRMNWLSQDNLSEWRVGDLQDYEGGEIRGLRVGVVGTFNFEKPWVYTLFGATNAFDKGFNEEQLDSFTLFDWRLDIPFFNNSVMSIGKQKEPISGERIQSMIFNHMQERSAAADALMPSRNVGLVWNGSSPEKYSSWAFGVFNDWFDADEDFDESASQYIGRLTWAPLRSQDDSNLLHLAIGYRYSDAKAGFRYLTEPEFNQSPIYVDTGFGFEDSILPADRTQTYNAELSWRRGPLWLASEYTRTNVASPTLGDPSFDGYFVGLSWTLTGEMRAYNRKSGTFGGVPVSRSVYQNGKGAWELTARWSSVNLNDGQINGGDMDIASVRLNWWATPFFGVSLDYRYIWNERFGLEDTSSGFSSRLLLLLE